MTTVLEEFEKIRRVLVWGRGLTTDETVTGLLALGYEVKQLSPDDRVRLERLEGFAGDFQVTLRALPPPSEKGERRSDFSPGEWTEQAGAVVFAPDLIQEENKSSFPISLSSNIISLKELSGFLSPNNPETPEGLGRPDHDEKDRGRKISSLISLLNPKSYVAFWIGLSNGGNVSDMAVAFSEALEIRRRFQSQVSIFCRQVKVAGEGLERLYQSCRNDGVLFFKFGNEEPVLTRKGSDLVIQFEDAVLQMPFTLTPDLLVVDSRHLLPPQIEEAASLARIGMDRSGYLQPANIHFWPQSSLREGIFIAGPGKGPMLPAVCIEEAGSVVLSVHHFFQGRVSEQMSREVSVDKGLCTLCLTCLRFCPHQAIGFTHRVFIHPLACRRCGICAGECPMDAIQIKGYSDMDMEKSLISIQKKWDRSEAVPPRIVIMGCHRSAGAAWEGLQNSRSEIKGSVEFIALPCAGKLDPDHILKAFVSGAEGILVLACPEENCRSVIGNTYAHDRLIEIRAYIEEAGINPERIVFDQLSSNMEWYLREIIRQLAETLLRSAK